MQSLGRSDIKDILEEHKANILSEVRRLIPATVAASSAASSAPLAAAGFDVQAVLAARDEEVMALEERLAGLQHILAEKDKRVADLGNELDVAVREVRHRQLDLEFQQLKLDERVRSNVDLEQAQRALTARVEEAGMSARHSALDVDLSRMTPRGLRVQGTLPWTLRKSRPDVM